MSNLWSHERAGEAACVGSFAIDRGAPTFTPWGGVEIDGPSLGPDGTLDFEAIYANGFSQGFEQGRQAVEDQLAEERAAIARMAETLEVLQPESTNALALLLAETVDRLVRQIVGTVEIDGALLTARAEAAAALIGAETEPARLRVNPEDIHLLEGARIPVEVVGDPTLVRGSIMLETGSGWIEDGPAVRLDRLRAELDRIGAAR
jgi:flagellar assembly protein FliH